MARKYSSISVETTLASGITSTQTTMTVASGTGSLLMQGSGFSNGDTFIVAIDPDTSNEEIVFISAQSSDTFTISRGEASSSNIAHAGGATVRHVFTGNDAQRFEDSNNNSVLLTGSQTITGAKTFSTAPVISSITNTGTVTLPTLTDTLVGRTTTDTLTNKTLTSPTINTAVENYPTFKSPQEIVTVSATAATGTINFDAKTQGVLYYSSNASANWTLNVRGDSSTTLSSLMDVGDSITVVFLNTNGTTAYYPTSFTIDGGSNTPKWQGGFAPAAGNASSVDAYVYNIIKTAATPTYLVLASQTKFA